MAMLGDLLASARDSASALPAWLAGQDSELARRVDEAAEQAGLDASGWMRMAVADFSRLANEEDWATLVSGLRESDDPGRQCLVAMVHWRLSVTGCADHSVFSPPQGAGP